MYLAKVYVNFQLQLYKGRDKTIETSHCYAILDYQVLGSLVKYTSKQGLWNGDAIWQSCQHISSATLWLKTFLGDAMDHWGSFNIPFLLLFSEILPYEESTHLIKVQFVTK